MEGYLIYHLDESIHYCKQCGAALAGDFLPNRCDNCYSASEDAEMDRRAEEDRCKDLEHATDETPEVRK